MDFNTLDKQMRRFEQSIDRTILEGVYIVARLDGHGFSRLTEKEWSLEKPFDIRFHEAMTATLKHLMLCGFHIMYGYTQSDEISLLFHLDEDRFGRKERKLISLLSAEASVAFSTHIGHMAVFDCRLVPLPNLDYVIDYFRWRQEDSHRNSLNAHCYWLFRKEGMSASNVQKRIAGLSIEERNELLFSHGINYNDLPLWQRRGIGAYFIDKERVGYNPVTRTQNVCVRRSLFVEEELPIGEKYADFIQSLIQKNSHACQ